MFIGPCLAASECIFLIRVCSRSMVADVNVGWLLSYNAMWENVIMYAQSVAVFSVDHTLT